ncbi:MAG TPA: EAL domain-containing protein [Rhodoferax sp.]|nr:EAL domain-containing protein [Rhodoferax sp.]
MISSHDILAAHILIVDDLPDNVQLLEQMLGAAGYHNVSATTDPYAVCELHRKNDYDLILLDLQMPGKDGFQVMQDLQDMQSGGYLPVLVVTAQPGHKLRALASGAKDFIAKPFDLVELKTRIHNMLEVRLLHKQLQDAVKTLESYALHDALTRLPNRRLLMDRLRQVMLASARSKHHCALMFLDIDNFKQLNDTLGHDMGDVMLQQVSARLLACAREGDSVARLGGDEFVVLLDGLSRQPQDAARQTDLVAKKMRDALGRTYQLGEHAYDSSLSMGVVVFLGETEAIEDLLKKADLAMYQSKGDSQNTVRFFDPVMQAQVQARETLGRELRQGVLQQEFVLCCQVQVDAAGVPTGAEALICWNHPTQGLLPTADFWPLAEATGTAVVLGQWALAAVCRQLLSWAKNPDTERWVVELRLSAGQFGLADFVETLTGLLQTSGVKPHLLMLTLTEVDLRQPIEKTVAKMEAVNACGVRLSLDEFGTGCSSLLQLNRWPLAQLRIAPSLVRAVLTDAYVADVSRAIVSLGQGLGLQVMAAGVDSAGQHQFLAAMGCTTFQGDFFGRAELPAIGPQS